MEPKIERIAEKLREVLAAIVGDGGTEYWYTPDLVARVEYFTASSFGKVAGVLHQIRQGQTFETEKPSGACDYQSEFFILASMPYTAGSDDPIEVAQLSLLKRDTLCNRMFGDIDKAIQQSVTLGGLALNTMLTDSDPRFYESGGRACVQVSVLVRWYKPVGEL